MDIAPAVLQDAAADPASPAWAVIWKESCHQGTCDPASTALLPWLAATIARFTDKRRETPIWGKELDHLNDGEADVRCPDCGEETVVDLLDDASALVAGLSCELAERLHAEATGAGRESVATALTRLFGRIDCPHCGTAFNVADHVAGASHA